MLKYFFEKYKDHWQKIVGSEVFLFNKVRLNDKLAVDFSCKVDLLHAPSPNTLEIIDFKTSSRGYLPSQEALKEDLSIFLYFLMTKLNYPDYETLDILYINLYSLEEVGHIYTKDQLELNKYNLIEAMETIEIGRFLPVKNQYCVYCPIKHYCPEFKYESPIDFIFGS